jgi:hypothetical protein
MRATVAHGLSVRERERLEDVAKGAGNVNGFWRVVEECLFRQREKKKKRVANESYSLDC